MLHCKASDVDDPTEEPRFGRVGKQVIEDTGPLTMKRMETIDDDITDRAIAFIKQAHEAGQPFFVWWNSTHMHFRTHIPKEAEGISGQGFYNDAMVLHDGAVGRLLDLLDELGIADDTIVQYSTDNGPALQHLAGCRHHALAQREEHQLGGRLPRACLRALAGQVRGGQNAQRHRHPPGVAAYPAGGGR